MQAHSMLTAAADMYERGATLLVALHNRLEPLLVCMRVCMRVCVCVCVRARACMRTLGLYVRGCSCAPNIFLQHVSFPSQHPKHVPGAVGALHADIMARHPGLI